MKNKFIFIVLIIVGLFTTNTIAQNVQIKANEVVLDSSLTYTGYFAPAHFYFTIDNDRYKVKKATIKIQNEGTAVVLDFDSNYLYSPNQIVPTDIIVDFKLLYDHQTQKDTVVSFSRIIKVIPTKEISTQELAAINRNWLSLSLNDYRIDCNTPFKAPKKNFVLDLKIPEEDNSRFVRCEAVLVRGFRPVAMQRSVSLKLDLNNMAPNISRHDFVLVYVIAKGKRDAIERIFSKVIKFE